MKALYKDGQECLLFLPHAPKRLPVTVLSHRETNDGVVYKVDLGTEVLPGIKNITSVDEWQLSPKKAKAKHVKQGDKAIKMAKKNTKKAGTKKAVDKPKKPRVKLTPERAKQVRAMLRTIREFGEDAKNGKKGAQRKLVF
jgi:hypothetical protein